MFKSLVRTLPTLTGNAKLSLKLNDYVQDKDNSNLFHVYIKTATIDPLQNNIYNHDIKVNLLEGSWEYDISRFYRNYFEKFYDTNYNLIKDDYIYYDPTVENINYRNKDYEFGCKRNSYFAYGYQFSFFAPIYITDINDLPDYFDLHISIKPNNEKIIRIHFGDDSYINKYLSKYLKQIDDKVIFILNESKRATYFGIDVEHGGFVNIIDNNINYIFNYQTPLNNFDSIINNGFVKNKLVIRQILPISFDFNIEDILSKNEYKQYSFFKINKIYGNYIKDYDNLPLYDFDIDYQMMEVNDKNVMSNNTFYSLQEAFLNIYKYDNKISPKYNKWKLSLSDQYDPYYFNINLNFNDSYNKYSQFPRLKNLNDIDMETYLYNSAIDINKMIKEGLTNGTITEDDISNESIVYEKYQFKRTIYIDDISDSLKEKLEISQPETIYNYIDINELTSLDTYKKNKSENISGWFNIINDINDIFSVDNEDKWVKCINNYSYLKGILYDFNDYVINKKINHLDYFSIFFLPSYIILNQNNDLFTVKSLFKRSKDDQYNYNFGINTIPLDNFIYSSSKNNLFSSTNTNTYLQTNEYIRNSEFDKTKQQYCLVGDFIETKFIDVNTFINILGFLLKSLEDDVNNLNSPIYSYLTSKPDYSYLTGKYIFEDNDDINNDITTKYLYDLVKRIYKNLFVYNNGISSYNDIRDFNSGLKRYILFDQYILINNIFSINNIISNDQTTFLNVDGNGTGDKSKYIYYKYKFDNVFKNLYEFPLDINNINENVQIEFYTKKNLININDLLNYIFNSIGENYLASFQTENSDIYTMSSDEKIKVNAREIFNNLYNYIINNIFGKTFEGLKLPELIRTKSFYYNICQYYNLIDLNFYNFNRENNIYFSKEIQVDRPIYVDYTNFNTKYSEKIGQQKIGWQMKIEEEKYITVKNNQQFNFLNELIKEKKVSIPNNVSICLPAYFDNYNELSQLVTPSYEVNRNYNDLIVDIKYLNTEMVTNTKIKFIKNKGEIKKYIDKLGYYTNVNICLVNNADDGIDKISISDIYSKQINNFTYYKENLFTYQIYISDTYLSTLGNKYEFKKLLDQKFRNKIATNYYITDINIKISENEEIFNLLCKYYEISSSIVEKETKETIYLEYVFPHILDDIHNNTYSVKINGTTIWKTDIIDKFETIAYILYKRKLVDVNKLISTYNLDIFDEINKNYKSYYLYSPISSNISDNYDTNFFISKKDDSLIIENATSIIENVSSYIGEQYSDYVGLYYNNQKYYFNQVTSLQEESPTSGDPIIHPADKEYKIISDENVAKEITKTNVNQLNKSGISLYLTKELLHEDIVEPIYNSTYYIDGENDYQKSLLSNGFIRLENDKYLYHSNSSFLNDYAYELSFSEIIDLLVEKILVQFINKDTNITEPIDIQGDLFKKLYNILRNVENSERVAELAKCPSYLNINQDSNKFLCDYFGIDTSKDNCLMTNSEYTDKYLSLYKYLSNPLNFDNVKNNDGFKLFIKENYNKDIIDCEEIEISDYINEFYNKFYNEVNLIDLYSHINIYFENLINNCPYIFVNKYKLEDIYETMDNLIGNGSLSQDIVNNLSEYTKRFENFDTILNGNGLKSITTLTKSLLDDTTIKIVDNTDNISISQNKNLENNNIYNLSLLNIIYSIITLSAYHAYCSAKGNKGYGDNDFYGNRDYILPIVQYVFTTYNIDNILDTLATNTTIDNILDILATNTTNDNILKSKIEICEKVIRFGLRILLVYLYNDHYEIFKKIIKENLPDINFYELSNYQRLNLLSFDNENFKFDATKLHNYQFIDNGLNTFDVNGKTYGCYIINSTISNSQNTFNLLNSVYFDHIKSNNQFYEISENILYNFIKELLPMIKYNLFDEFSRSFKTYNPILLPEKFILSTQYMVEKNVDLTNSYILNNDISNIVIDSFNTKSYDEYKPYLYKLKKYPGQNLVIYRYTNFIEPVFIQADNLYLYNVKYKDNKALFGNDNIYRSYININKYEGIPLFSNKNQKYLSSEYETIKEIEYKSFNDNQFFLMIPKFEIKFNKYFTYEEILEFEKNEKIIEYFTNYVQKFNINSKLEKNEILFLFNKYKVTFISNPIKLDLNKTKKLYTLKYIFTLL